ncbi:MAG: ATP-binding protein, partial [Rhodospirillaceae bacterium]|nr:ATP-binding protein [Rhodospirillaceae bacterium]
ITVSAKMIGEWAEVIVTDTGVGIPKEKLSKLFDLGEKTSTAGTRGEAGTGLGLNLCKDLVEKHGGEISVDSSEGKGTSIHFTLPTAP